jgi:uncharacterized protein (TIGR02217 family)
LSNAIFPKLKGKAWGTKFTPMFSTRVSKATSGREVRNQLYKYPLYQIELVYSGLSASPDPAHSNLGAESKQAIEGFFLSRAGQFDHFLVRMSDVTADRFDSWVEGQQLGVGNGAMTAFTFLREVTLPAPNPPYLEPVGQVEPQGVNVYVNGTKQTSSTYAITWPNQVTFNAAPAAGAIITADYFYYFVCRFMEDQLEFQNFAYLLWRLGSVKLQTVKLP